MVFGLTFGLGVRYEPASGFLPSALPVLNLWLDAADPATITQIGGAVSQWNDKSGMGHHATQGVSASQPQSGTRTLNARNVLDFDGSNDHMILPSGLYGVTQGSSHLFIVFARDVLGSENYPLWGNSGSHAWGVKLSTGTSPQQGRHGTGFVHLGYISDNNAHILQMNRSSSILYGSLDNGAESYVFANNFTLTDLAIGRRHASLLHNGPIAEILIYNRVLDSGESAAVHNYLKSKWGTP